MMYVADHGCKWHGLSKPFGRWHTIYARMNRWAKSGMLNRVVEHLQPEQVVSVKLEAASLDSGIVEGVPRRHGRTTLKEVGPSPSGSLVADGSPRFVWLPRMLERP